MAHFQIWTNHADFLLVVDFVTSTQCHISPPRTCIMAARCRCKLATKRFMRSTGILAHLSNKAWCSSVRFCQGSPILLTTCLNLSQMLSIGVQSHWYYVLYHAEVILRNMDINRKSFSLPIVTFVTRLKKSSDAFSLLYFLWYNACAL